MKNLLKLLHGNIISLSVGVVFIFSIILLGTSAYLNESTHHNTKTIVTTHNQTNKTTNTGKKVAGNTTGNTNASSVLGTQAQNASNAYGQTPTSIPPTTLPVQAQAVVENYNPVATSNSVPSTPTNAPNPTCRPRPACLDSNPRCMIAETPDMCPPTQLPQPQPTTIPQGQTQPTIVPMTTSQPQVTSAPPQTIPHCQPITCPPGAMCAQMICE